MEEPKSSEEKKPDPQETIGRLAEFLERTQLAAYVDLMNDTKRLMWLNFVGGIARGIGQFIGFAVIGALLVVILGNVLKHYFHHMGGVPFGKELDAMIGWILQVIENHKVGHG